MGYVDTIVQSGLSLAERAQVVKYVDKAREFEKIDTVLDLVGKHGPQVVEMLDKRVELALGGVNESKAKVLEQYEKVQQKKNDVVEFAQAKTDNVVEFAQAKKDNVLEFAQTKKDNVLEFAQTKKDTALEFAQTKKDTALEFAQTKKDTALEFAQTKKDTALEFAQTKKDTVLEFAQTKKDGVLAMAKEQTDDVQKRARRAYDGASVKSADLLKQIQQRTNGTRAEQLVTYLVLVADVVVTRSESLARTSLALPVTLKERMEEKAAEATRRARELGPKITVVLVGAQKAVVRVASREFVVPRAQEARAAVERCARGFVADPRGAVAACGAELKQRSAAALAAMAPLGEKVQAQVRGARVQAAAGASALQVRCADAFAAAKDAQALLANAPARVAAERGVALLQAKAGEWREMAAAATARVGQLTATLKPHRD